MGANGCATCSCGAAVLEACGEELDAWPLWWCTGIASPASPQLNHHETEGQCPSEQIRVLRAGLFDLSVWYNCRIK